MKLVPLRALEFGEAARLPLGPAALAVDRRHVLYAAIGAEVWAFDPQGRLLRRIDAGGAISALTVADEQLWMAVPGAIRIASLVGAPVGVLAGDATRGPVTGLAIGADTVVVADAGRREVCRFRRDGVFLGVVGAEINGRGFLIPNGALSVATAPNDETFWIAHPGRHRLEQFGFDGAYRGCWGRFGNERLADFAGCCNPTTVAVGPGGWLAVAEKAPPRIKVFTADGSLAAWSDADVFDASGKNLALTVDARGVLYVADPPRRRAVAFQLEAAGPTARAPGEAS
jgi:sugar lactone lactonase YvrE